MCASEWSDDVAAAVGSTCPRCESANVLAGEALHDLEMRERGLGTDVYVSAAMTRLRNLMAGRDVLDDLTAERDALRAKLNAMYIMRSCLSEAENELRNYGSFDGHIARWEQRIAKSDGRT